MQTSDYVGLCIAAGVILLILFVPYLIWNTLLAWFTSHLMQFRENTVGNALKLSFLQLVLPVPLGILSGVGIYTAAQQFMAGNANHQGYALLYAICGGLIVMWIISVLIAAGVYSVGLIKGAVLNALLILIHGSVAFAMSLRGLIANLNLPHG